MNSENEIKTIAWIGTGVMGRAMADHLLKAGFQLRIFTRTRAKAEPLLQSGAAWADAPADAAAGADAVISIVGDPKDVRETYFGANGVLSLERPPSLLIDMTTSEPSLAIEIADAARAKGAGSLDAPVSGGDVGARNATLSIMVGGAPDDFERALPMFRAMGRTILHQGDPGAGQHTKMVNQILIATGMIGVCEGLIYAQRAGLDPLRVIESVSTGAAGSWSVSHLGPRMIARDFEPGFYVEHFVKDLGIAVAEAERMGLDLPGLTLGRALYRRVEKAGGGRKGTQALFTALEELAASTSDSA